MIRILSRSPDAASPRMLLISVGLHAILLCAIILFSYSITRPPIPKEVVNRVTLVESSPGPPVAERTKRDPINSPAILPREKPEPQTSTKDRSESVRQVLEPTAISTAQNQAISLRKRRPAKHVEKPKKPKPVPKKSDKSLAKKQEDPQKYLERKLASIQERVKNIKSDASRRPTVSADPSGLEKTGSKDGERASQEELRRWLEDVRSRINSRWSVFGDRSQVSRPTEIGVKIDDNGRLTGATVNQSSGNQVFDQSALRAVYQADPFPAIQPEVREQIRKAGGLALRFAPGGMQ
jgi:TonB family protein